MTDVGSARFLYFYLKSLRKEGGGTKNIVLLYVTKTMYAMNANEQTCQQIERALRKVASKFQMETENPPLTDFYLQVKQESGELLVFNDDEEELTRCVVEEWIGNTSENFYEEVQPVLRGCLERLRDLMSGLHVLRPYSYVLMNEEKNIVADLFLVDDDVIVIDGELMLGLEEDLEKFWEELSAK